MKTEYQIGEKAKIARTFSDAQVLEYANLSMDNNPIHLDKKIAQKSVFGQRVVHGMFVSSLFSFLIGTELPGEGSIYLEQNLKFLKPIFLNQEIVAEVEIVHIREDKRIMTLNTNCFNPKGEQVISGTAIVRY